MTSVLRSKVLPWLFAAGLATAAEPSPTAAADGVTARLAAGRALATAAAARELDAIVWAGAPDEEGALGLFAPWEREQQALAGRDLEPARLSPGFPALLKSDEVAGMKPGFLVAVLGFCTPEESGAALAYLRAVDHAGIYSRRVKVRFPPSCPRVPPGVTATLEKPRLQTASGSSVEIGRLTLDLAGDQDPPEPRATGSYVVKLRSKEGFCLDVAQVPRLSVCSETVTTRKTAVVVRAECRGYFAARELCTYAPRTVVTEVTVDEKQQRLQVSEPPPPRPERCGE